MCCTVYCKSVVLGKKRPDGDRQLFALRGGRAVSSQLTASCEQLARTMHRQKVTATLAATLPSTALYLHNALQTSEMGCIWP
jgi:hypothetical protein